MLFCKFETLGACYRHIYASRQMCYVNACAVAYVDGHTQSALYAVDIYRFVRVVACYPQLLRTAVVEQLSSLRPVNGFYSALAVEGQFCDFRQWYLGNSSRYQRNIHLAVMETHFGDIRQWE